MTLSISQETFLVVNFCNKLYIFTRTFFHFFFCWKSEYVKSNKKTQNIFGAAACDICFIRPTIRTFIKDVWFKWRMGFRQKRDSNGIRYRKNADSGLTDGWTLKNQKKKRTSFMNVPKVASPCPLIWKKK